MKEEITIPPQYVETLVQQAAERGISADELAEIAITKLLEGSLNNV